jgi:hypothetical protein
MFTDVSEMLAASIIRAIALTTVHGATTQKTVISILAAVRTRNLARFVLTKSLPLIEHQ